MIQETMVVYFPELLRDTNSQIQEAPCFPAGKENKFMSRSREVKLQCSKDKEMVFKNCWREERLLGNNNST